MQLVGWPRLLGCATPLHPLFGGVLGQPRLELGDLALLVGGEPADIAACREVLDALGEVHVLGGLGAGQTAKLANQIVFFGAQAALQEAVALARANGVDVEALHLFDPESGASLTSDGSTDEAAARMEAGREQQEQQAGQPEQPG